MAKKLAKSSASAGNGGSLCQVLREALLESGSLYAAAQATGVPYATLHDFAHGSDARGSTLDKLAEYLGYALTPVATISLPAPPAKKGRK